MEIGTKSRVKDGFDWIETGQDRHVIRMCPHGGQHGQSVWLHGIHASCCDPHGGFSLSQPCRQAKYEGAHGGRFERLCGLEGPLPMGARIYGLMYSRLRMILADMIKRFFQSQCGWR